jgi:hypothetical protein
MKHLRELRTEDVIFSRKTNASKDNINMPTLFQRGQLVRTNKESKHLHWLSKSI